jgi:hypothetical protein
VHATSTSKASKKNTYPMMFFDLTISPVLINSFSDHRTSRIHRRHHINVGDGVIVVRDKHEGRLGQLLASTAK